MTSSIAVHQKHVKIMFQIIIRWLS